jgi:hypothetical protein
MRDIERADENRKGPVNAEGIGTVLKYRAKKGT